MVPGRRAWGLKNPSRDAIHTGYLVSARRRSWAAPAQRQDTPWRLARFVKVQGKHKNLFAKVTEGGGRGAAKGQSWDGGHQRHDLCSVELSSGLGSSEWVGCRSSLCVTSDHHSTGSCSVLPLGLGGSLARQGAGCRPVSSHRRSCSRARAPRSVPVQRVKSLDEDHFLTLAKAIANDVFSGAMFSRGAFEPCVCTYAHHAHW